MIPLGTYPAGTKLKLSPSTSANERLFKYTGTILTVGPETIITSDHSVVFFDKMFLGDIESLYAKHLELPDSSISTVHTHF